MKKGEKIMKKLKKLNELVKMDAEEVVERTAETIDYIKDLAKAAKEGFEEGIEEGIEEYKKKMQES